MGKKQGGQTLLLTPAALVLLVFMVLPMLWVGLMSFLEPDPYGGVCWGQWTFDAYIRFIMDRDLDEQWVLNTDYLRIFARSFGLALCAVVVTLLVGFPLALYIALQKGARRNHELLLFTIPVWVNLLVRTFAWILLLRNGGRLSRHW